MRDDLTPAATPAAAAASQFRAIVSKFAFKSSNTAADDLPADADNAPESGSDGNPPCVGTPTEAVVFKEPQAKKRVPLPLPTPKQTPKKPRLDSVRHGSETTPLQTSVKLETPAVKVEPDTPVQTPTWVELRRSPRLQRQYQAPPTPISIASRATPGAPRPPRPPRPVVPRVKSQELGFIPDHLGMNLKVLFVGFNPGIKSSQTGHHYAGRNNHFWPCLYESGMVPEPLTHADDASCPEQFGLGLTNIVARPTPGSKDLTKEELRAGVLPLMEKIRRYRPRIVYDIFIGAEKPKNFKYGLQSKRITLEEADQSNEKAGSNEVLLFAMPSSSGRVASHQKSDKLKLFKKLKKVVDSLH